MGTPFIEEEKKPLTCDFCDQVDDSVQRTIDPYTYEVEGLEELVTICEDCHKLRIEDV